MHAVAFAGSDSEPAGPSDDPWRSLARPPRGQIRAAASARSLAGSLQASRRATCSSSTHSARARVSPRPSMSPYAGRTRRVVEPGRCPCRAGRCRSCRGSEARLGRGRVQQLTTEVSRQRVHARSSPLAARRASRRHRAGVSCAGPDMVDVGQVPPGHPNQAVELAGLWWEFGGVKDARRRPDV
jgi:hypothetical protein